MSLNKSIFYYLIFLFLILNIQKNYIKENLIFLYNLNYKPAHKTINEKIKEENREIKFIENIFKKNHSNIKNPHKIAKLIFYECRKYNIDIKLCLSIIKIESNFNYKAVSHKNAIGLMQILFSTAKDLNKDLKLKNINLFDPETNIKFGIYYLFLLHKKYKDLNKIIINYNAGIYNNVFNKNNKYLKKVKNEFSKFK